MSEKAAASAGLAARTACLGLMVLMGCDGSKGGGAGDGGIPRLPGSDAAAPVCGSFNACGGSVVGTWKYPPTVECGPASTTDPSSVCPGYSRTGEAQMTGSVTFFSDGTFRISMVFDGAYQASYPVSCMGGTACPATLGEPGVSMTCSETPPGTCRCDYVFDNYSSPDQSGTYSTSGGRLTTVDASDGSEDTVDYCVQGNTLRVHGIDESTGEPMTIVLTKQ